MGSLRKERRVPGGSMSFADQVAVVTGASSGIGWALCKELAGRGCKVGLLARRPEQLEQLAKEIEQARGTAGLAPADGSHRPPTLEALHSLNGKFGPCPPLAAHTSPWP